MPFITSVRGTYSSLTGRSGRAAKNLSSITGGDSITTPGDGYRYHTFTNPGTFDASAVGGTFLVDYLVVGGGGGGGGELSDQYNAGGGGGGGVLTASGATFSSTSYGVTTGAGGRYYSKPGVWIGENGGNSTLGPAIIAYGGGGGGVDSPGGSAYGTPQGPNGWNGQPGGSGGGGGNYSADGPGGAGVAGQGYPGGTGGPGAGYPSGGGGGAGSAGQPGGNGYYGAGGDSLLWPANGVRYGGGGGGGATDVANHAGSAGKDPGGLQNNPQGGGGYGFTGGDGFNPNYPSRVGYLGGPAAGAQAWVAGYPAQYTPVSGYLQGQGMGGGGAGRIPATIGEGCSGSSGSVIVRYSLAQ